MMNGFAFESMPAGKYFDTLFLNTIYGCDSIVRLRLTVNPAYDTLIDEEICQGEDYMMNGFAFESMPAGSYSDTLFLNTIYGCDSIVRLRLNVNPAYDSSVFDTICHGDDYLLYGLAITNPDVGANEYTSLLQSINGCDSVFNVNLEVLEIYDEVEIVGEESLLVSTNITTGRYIYSIGDVDDNETYFWKIDNSEWKINASNSECTVWATTPGKCTLTVMGGNSCGTVTDDIVLHADFFDEVNDSRIMMYPNPAKDIVNFMHRDITRINVYDSYGQLILRNDYGLDSHVTLDLSSLVSSVYFIEIITAERTFIERISVLR
jgi:hypothetical protein